MAYRKLLIATHNAGKLNELKGLFAKVPLQLLSLTDQGIEKDVEETGSTMEENATLKAQTYANLCGLPTLADDSGLEVAALGGDPGVFSARYAGEGATDAQRIALLHYNLRNIPQEQWNARFRCVIAIVWPPLPIELYTGICHGMIINPPRGENGFGYDPIFLFPKLKKTMAELSIHEKNVLSHRGVAARKATAVLGQRVIASEDLSRIES